MTKNKMSGLIAALAFVMSAPAMAVPLTLDWTGLIQSYQVANNGDFVFSSPFDLSTRVVTGTMTYDPELGPTPLTSDVGGFQSFFQGSLSAPFADFVTGTAEWANGTFNHLAITPTRADFVSVSTIDDIGFESFLLVDKLERDVAINGGASLIALRASAVSPDTVLNPAEALPPLNPSLWSFDIAQYTTGGLDVYNGYILSGNLTSISVRPTTVPEPSTLALMVLGLIGIGCIQRRKTSP